MSKRVKNFKIFIGTLSCILIIGTGMLIKKYYLNDAQELKRYSKNKDSFEYNVLVDYSSINTDMILTEEQIYLSDEEYKLYEKTIYLSFVKKISKLAFQGVNIQEADTFYESKYSTDVVISSESSKYKDIKNKHILKYLDGLDDSNKYLTVNNTYLLKSKEEYDYIKEVVYFVNPETYLVEKGLEIDFKYNHKNDDLQYSEAHIIADIEINSINNLLEDSINVYDDLNSKKDVFAERIETEYGFKVYRMYVFDSNTVIANSIDNKESIQYSY